MRARALAYAVPVLALAVLSMSLLAPAAGAQTPTGSSVTGAAFTQTNAVAGNEIVAYYLSPTGTLSWAGNFSTGGTGSGASLADAGSLALSSDHRWLFAVDAGSNQVSVFRVGSSSLSPLLRLTDVATSGGSTPVSVTVHDSLVYVLNDGNATTAGSIRGFHLTAGGILVQIPGATAPLSTSSATAAAQIGFNPLGHLLVVTEKNTNTIDLYRVSPNGLPTYAANFSSNGSTPYGFTFDARGQLLVTNAASDSLSSYVLGPPDSLTTVSGSVPDGQVAPCWVATMPAPRGGSYAFTSDAHSDNLSAYWVGVGGRLTLLSSSAAVTGAADTDLALVRTVGMLYTYDAGAGEIQSFSIGPGAVLTANQSISGLPASALGLVAF